MYSWLWGWIPKAPPVGIRLLVIGVITGLVVGALGLDESADTATAVGIATGFSVVMGLWLGIRLYLMVVRLYTAWISAIRKRFTDIETRLHSIASPTDENDIKPERASFAINIVAYSIYVTPFCFAVSSHSVIMGALWSQIDCSCASISQDFALVSLIYSSGLLFFTVGIQCLYLLRLQRRVALLERRLNRAGLISPVAMRADVMDSNIARAERLVRRLVGISEAVAKRAPA
jgi:hypothetical protein